VSNAGVRLVRGRLGLETTITGPCGPRVAGAAQARVCWSSAKCDGEEGVRLALEHQASVVWMDIAMPGVDGLEATRRIRLLAPNVRVLSMTGLPHADIVHKAFNAGAEGFLAKSEVANELPRAFAVLAAGTRFITRSLTDVQN